MHRFVINAFTRLGLLKVGMKNVKTYLVQQEAMGPSGICSWSAEAAALLAPFLLLFGIFMALLDTTKLMIILCMLSARNAEED